MQRGLHKIGHSFFFLLKDSGADEYVEGPTDDDAEELMMMMMMMMMLGDVVEVMLLLVIMEDRAAGSSCSPAATAAVLIDEEPSMWSLMRDSNKIFYQQQVLSSHPFTSLCVSACCCIGVSSLQVWRHPCWPLLLAQGTDWTKEQQSGQVSLLLLLLQRFLTLVPNSS